MKESSDLFEKFYKGSFRELIQSKRYAFLLFFFVRTNEVQLCS